MSKIKMVNKMKFKTVKIYMKSGNVIEQRHVKYVETQAINDELRYINIELYDEADRTIIMGALRLREIECVVVTKHEG